MLEVFSMSSLLHQVWETCATAPTILSTQEIHIYFLLQLELRETESDSSTWLP